MEKAHNVEIQNLYSVFLYSNTPTYRTKIEDREGSHVVLDPDQQKWNAENQVHNEKYFLLVDHAFLF